MGARLHSLLDAERLAQCQAADEADRLADAERCDWAVIRAREGQRYQRPYWIFAERRPDQLAITHPLASARKAAQRPDPSRFDHLGDLS